MFANTFRTQARLALTSCRARVSAVTATYSVARVTALPTLSTSTSRLISTSRPVWDYGVGDRQSGQATQPQKSLFVGNLPFSVEEAELREKFEPFGEIEAVRISYRPDGTARGFAHVEFANEADAAAAVKSITEEPVYLLDRDLRVDFAQRRAKAPDAREPTHSLYFHGFRGDQEALRQATRSFESSIINVFFIKDRETGLETGSGFIHFMSVERATEALNELNGEKEARGAEADVIMVTGVEEEGEDVAVTAVGAEAVVTVAGAEEVAVVTAAGAEVAVVTAVGVVAAEVVVTAVVMIEAQARTVAVGDL
ncbi:hypothetical protein D9615_007655 [Tricholomella constricta]|uniref:RRM domain-containing protein n=1 Tax=Tricholomella constricta TaxID=117010 RepID=A0A8H5M0B6_9AGAR|nr:hypothetical protein D9615_007655 [Tricholomella constricta]